jgi:hypothetical protein
MEIELREGSGEYFKGDFEGMIVFELYKIQSVGIQVNQVSPIV